MKDLTYSHFKNLNLFIKCSHMLINIAQKNFKKIIGIRVSGQQK